MSGSERRRLDAEQRRAQLVATGLELAKRLPVDQVTAPDVARAAGVSKGLVFHYFPAQRDLQAAVAKAAADELIEQLARVDTTRPREQRLRQGIEEFITYVERTPTGYATIARGAGSDERLRALFEDTREAVVVLVGYAMGADPSADARTHLLLRGWVAMVEEMTLRWIEDRRVERVELIEMLAHMADAVIATTSATA